MIPGYHPLQWLSIVTRYCGLLGGLTVVKSPNTSPGPDVKNSFGAILLGTIAWLAIVG